MQNASVDPVARLALIQGPVRHVWWSFWTGLGVRLLSLRVMRSGYFPLFVLLGSVAVLLRVWSALLGELPRCCCVIGLCEITLNDVPECCFHNVT
jgi:hypothetical protein